MSRLLKSKKLWQTTPAPEVEQLSLMPAPVARSARAELVDAANRSRAKLSKKWRRGDPERHLFKSWPKDREEVLVLVGDEGEHGTLWLPGYMDGWHMEARDGGEFGGQKVIDQVKVHDIKLQPEKAEGLSESLKASLPRYVRVERLDQLRRP